MFNKIVEFFFLRRHNKNPESFLSNFRGSLYDIFSFIK